MSTTEIARIAAAAALPEYTSLLSRGVELTAKLKTITQKRDHLSELAGTGTASFSNPHHQVSQQEIASARERLQALQLEIDAISAERSDLQRNLGLMRPSNASAVRAALEPDRRRADARMAAALEELRASAETWDAIVAEYNRADVPGGAPAHVLSLKALLEIVHVIA